MSSLSPRLTQKTLVLLLWGMAQRFTLNIALGGRLKPCRAVFQYQFRVVPGGSRQLTYNLYPLLSGRLTLPRPRLTLYRDGAPVEAAELIDAALRHLPTHVYVMVSLG